MGPRMPVLITNTGEENVELQQPAAIDLDFAVSPEFELPELSSWTQIEFPIVDTSVNVDDFCSNIFIDIPDVELNLNPLPPEQNIATFPLILDSPCLALDGGNASGVDKGKSIVSEDPVVPKNCGKKREKNVDVLDTKQTTMSKRMRAQVVHNLSERRRRDRINERIKTLRGLIPNCTKTDRASVLDEAIRYLKGLKVQVETMSMMAGIQSVHLPQFSTFMPLNMNIGTGGGVGMGYGMGMVGMCYPMGTPFIADPSLSPCSAGATAARSGVVPIAALVPMNYTPFTAVTSTPATDTPSISLECLALNANPSNQAGSSSQMMQGSVNDVQQVPVNGQAERADLCVEGCLPDGNK